MNEKVKKSTTFICFDVCESIKKTHGEFSMETEEESFLVPDITDNPCDKEKLLKFLDSLCPPFYRAASGIAHSKFVIVSDIKEDESYKVYDRIILVRIEPMSIFERIKAALNVNTDSFKKGSQRNPD